MNSWVYGKPNMVALSSQAPGKAHFLFLHSFTHCSSFKMTQMMNWYWWGDFYKITKTAYQQCLTSQVHNPEKTIFVSKGLRFHTSGHFEQLWLDFIQLPLSMGYQYALVIVCMFSTWVEAFPCRKAADALTEAKKLLENKFPTQGILSTISSDQGNHFTGKIIWALIETLQTFWNHHCLYDLQSSGKGGRINGILNLESLKFLKLLTPPGIRYYL